MYPRKQQTFISICTRPPTGSRFDVAQDRLTEKTSLRVRTSVAGFQNIETYEDLQKYMRGLTVKALLKPVDLDMMAKASGE